MPVTKIRAKAIRTSEMNRITSELYKKMNLIHIAHNAKLMKKYGEDMEVLVAAKSQDFQDLWKYIKGQGCDIDEYLDTDGGLCPTEIDVNYMLEDAVRVVVQTYYDEEDIESSMKTIKEKLLEMYKL